MELKTTRVGLVGLGLLGASVAGKLTEDRSVRSVFGWDIDSDVRHTARSRGLAEVPERLEDVVAHADVLLFAVPWRALAAADEAARAATLATETTPWAVMDLCSGKRAPGALLRRSWGKRYVGFHPMAGKERGGIANASPELFFGASCAVVPFPETSEDVIRWATRLAGALGMHPVNVDAEAHDAAVGAVSHLPHLLASALVLVAEEERQRHPVLAHLAGSGFRDTTRVASCPADLGVDMASANGDHLRRLTRRLTDLLEELLALPSGAFEERLRAAAAARQHLLAPTEGGRGA